MTKIPFYKMHGAGNDFVVIDRRTHPVSLSPSQMAALADRNRSIGFDQLVMLDSPSHSGADVMVRFFNTDGTQAGACGNASRCVVYLLHEQTGRSRYILQTLAGLLPASYEGKDFIEVNMGLPHFRWEDIPLAKECDTNHLPLTGDPAGVSMGNPHMTFFVPQLSAVNVAELGAAFTRHPLYPQGANVGFAEMHSPSFMRLRVWERGTGLTLACGSGACAAVANAIRRGVSGKTCEVEVDGGVLHITQNAQGDMLMRGPAVLAYEGVIELNGEEG
ncbi:diaminopimelate epimerase [Entomobacter blattae]|uniref:Diaminopimelate epimerase n=1 Tax=Entomobacter blattae TaxID=2762277 RepID=A0A7H1NQ49_9PROT|nr:Diaminopimelate epimerase [Entomobacter blattae]